MEDIVQFVAMQPNIDRCLFNKQRRYVNNIPKQEIKLFLFQLIAGGNLVLTYDEDSKTVMFNASITQGSQRFV